MSKNKIYDPETNTVFWDELLKIPEFKSLSETPQNILWHKEGDAFTHTHMVTECMIKYIENANKSIFFDTDYREVLIFSALLHDIGKTVTTIKGEDGLYHCMNHAIKGVPIAKNILDMCANDIQIENKNAILSLVRYHMQPLYILNNRDPKLAILKLANNLKYIDFESLLLLKRCDCEGSISEEKGYHEEILDSVRKLYYEECSYPANTMVTLIKVGDAVNCNYETGHHPNGINTGYTASGRLYMPITVGYRTILGLCSFSTSPVVKIINKNYFETKNSVYKIVEFKANEVPLNN